MFFFTAGFAQCSEAGPMCLKIGDPFMRATAVIHKKSCDFEKEKWMAYDGMILIDFH